MPSRDPWQRKTHLGDLPVAPVEILERVYGRAIRRMSRPAFLAYCRDRQGVVNAQA